MTSHAKNVAKLTELVQSKVDKVNSDLLALTYGSFVTQLLKDYGNLENVNEKLESVGVNMGSRLIEEFLAKSNIRKCKDFTETMELLVKVGFKMFLGITADIIEWDSSHTCCIITFLDNPLADFVELPSSMKDLNYSCILCGTIRGALEQLYIVVTCSFVKDTLKGDSTNEIRVELKSVQKEEFNERYDTNRP